MHNSIAANRRASQINSLDDVKLRPAKVATLDNSQSTPVNANATPVNPVDLGWVDGLYDAIDGEMSRKEAAYTLGVDPAQLSRGAVTLDRLKKLPLLMQQTYLELMCAKAGLKVSKASKQDELIAIAEQAAIALINALKAQGDRP